MVLREERNEENQSLWSKRFERERLDLSASVEAALVVDSTLERQWLDEFDEQDVSPLATDGTASVSPQVSWQSSLLPQVMPQRPQVTVTTDASPAVSSLATESTEQQSHRTSILARLARRFTSSLTAVDTSEKQELQPQQSVSEQKKPLTQKMEAYQARGVNTSVEPAEYADEPLVRVIDAISIHSTNGVKENVSPHKKRSLKGNKKVRLETTEQPVVPRDTKAQKRETSELPLPLSENMLRPQWSSFAVESSTTNEIPQIAASHGPFFGSGVCASGQRDAMVTCTHITSGSVVLVTLTSNPGPVVVQYVSLQPQTGFTLHLTSPVTERTTFNYIVL